jgi:hypothetical protein
MRMKKVSISFAAVIWRSRNGRTTQNFLINHKFAVVFADRTFGSFEIRIRITDNGK